jgi:hypothetical protein
MYKIKYNEYFFELKTVMNETAIRQIHGNYVQAYGFKLFN